MRSIAPTTRAALVALAMCTSPVAAQKTDMVRLRNGNEITGEIKQLDRGRLEYGTDDLGTVNIEWDEIEQLTSVLTFEVELGSGERFFGSLSEGAPPGSIIVGTVDPDTLSMTSVVQITPIEASFVQRLNGFVDVGFSYTRANRETTLYGSGRVRYRGRRWGSTVEGSSYFQAQEQTETTTRNDLSVSSEIGAGVVSCSDRPSRTRSWTSPFAASSASPVHGAWFRRIPACSGSAPASCSPESASTTRSPRLERTRDR